MLRRYSPLCAVVAACALSAVAVLPASAQTRFADCVVGVTELGEPVISCLDVQGSEARARADCAYAPDTYTGWVRAYQSDIGGACLFDWRGAILEIRVA